MKVPTRLNIRNAFTLIELLVVIAIIALLVAILLPALGTARNSAKLAQSLNNLKQFANATNSYATDFKDRPATFSWVSNRPYQVASGYSNGSFTTTTMSGGNDLEAVSLQALDIIRRRAVPDWVNMPQQANWIPHPTYNHLVLIDYWAGRLPEPVIYSPFDRFRLTMAEDPGRWRSDAVAGPAGYRITWPYSSSYQASPSLYTPDKFSIDGGSLQSAGDQIFYLFNGGSGNRYKLGQKRLASVAFPAQKVVYMEDVGRHQNPKREFFFTHPQSISCIATYDGAARQIATKDVNAGGYWLPNGTRADASFDYTEQLSWGYPTWAGGPTTQPGRHRWTFKHMQGIDFGSTQPLN
ncbi:MAG: type II secretion system protein [Phycisphaerales bacterium]